MFRFFCIGLLLLFPLFLFSTDYDVYKIIYGVESGLPSPECYEIIQDSKGYIWFGTDNGVVRYNGIKFKTFTTKDGFNNNVNYNLSEDVNGNIWCYNKTHQLFCIRNDSVHPFKFNDILKNNIEDLARPIGFSFDSLGTLNISLANSFNENQLTQIDKFGNLNFLETDTFDLYIDKSKATTTFTSRYFPHGSAYRREYCHLIRLKNETMFANFKLPTQKPSVYRWIYRYAESDTTLYFSVENRLYAVNNKFEIEKIHEFDKGIIELELNDEGDLFIGLTEEGLWVVPKGDFSKLNQLIENCSVSSFLIDRVGSYWISTLDRGIFYIPSLDFFEHWGSCGADIKHIAGNQSSIIYSTRNGKVDIVSDHVSLPEFTQTNYVNDIIAVNDSSYLISTGENYSYFLNSITAPPLFKPLRAEDWCKMGDAYYGISGSGIVKLNGINLDSSSLIHKSSYNLNCICPSIFVNQLLLGTNNGVYVYANDTIRKWKTNSQLLNTEIVDLIHLWPNVLIAATASKGLIIHRAGKRPFSITKEIGLISNNLNKLYVYKNKFFVLTKDGLSVFTIRENTSSFYISNYSTGNGLSSNVLNDIFIRNDTAWVATSMGISRFAINLDQSVKNVDAPIVLNAVKVDNQRINTNQKIVLNDDVNTVEILFDILSYSENFGLVRRYKLQGLHNNWKYTQSNNAIYSGLETGTYNFILSYKKINGEWSVPITLLNFEKTAPFWRPLWTAFIIAFAFIILGWIIGRRYIKRKKKETKIKKTISDLERRALQAQMNPHFIFNSLTSIQSLIVQDKNQEAETFLVAFSKLVRKALNQSSNDSFSNLGDELELLENYIKLESLRFSHSFNYTIEVANEIDVADYQIPPMIIQPFVENAIEHGLMKSQNDRKLEISIQPYDTDLLTCIISDNGIGRQAAKKSSEKNGHKSKGIALIKDRLKIINANAIVTFSDLDVTKNNCGTKVTITIPYKNLAE